MQNRLPNANQETQHLAQNPEYRWVPPIATASDSLRNALKEDNAEKALNCARESDALRDGASDFENAPRRTATNAEFCKKCDGFCLRGCRKRCKTGPIRFKSAASDCLRRRASLCY